MFKKNSFAQILFFNDKYIVHNLFIYKVRE